MKVSLIIMEYFIIYFHTICDNLVNMNFSFQMGSMSSVFKFFRTCVIVAGIAVIVGCAAGYTTIPSKNASERVKLLVMHFTAIDYEKSLRALVDEGGLSAHYLVADPSDPSYQGDDDLVLQLVDEGRRAWHAGTSYWQNRTNLNDTSIGIEIVNVPSCERDNTASMSRSEHGRNRLCVFPDFNPAQIQAVIRLSKEILARNPDIHPTAVVGHSDIAYTRKNDPGPRFPWFELYKAGIGAWYDNDTLTKYWKRFNQRLPETGLFQKALRDYGYDVTETGVFDENTYSAISAFQMHFVQDGVNGQLNSETAAALFALLEKYFPNKLNALMARYERELALKTELPPPVTHGQIDSVFPQEIRSDRKEVNDKLRFAAYKGRGEIFLRAEQDTHATITVNGEELNIATPLLAGKTYHYSLKRRTKDGINALSIKTQNDTDKLHVRIPWPTLQDDTENWQTRFVRVDALINEEIAAGFPGAALLVVKDGKIIKRSAYGYARKYSEDGTLLANPQPLTPETLFDMASNTKMLATNFALMKLVSEGKIHVDDPLYVYLPEYHGDGREARTVRDLLSHQTGYGPEVRFFQPQKSYGKGFFSRSKPHTNYLLATKVPFREGNKLKAKYSDTNFMLLGLLVERVTGMSLDRYCEQLLYSPLQLNHTMFNPLQKGVLPTSVAATEINGNTRSGHIHFPGVREYTLQGEVHDEKAWYSMQGVAGHAGLFSTIDDVGVLLQLLLNQGGYANVTLFDEQTLSLFTAPSSLDPGFGLGWRRAADGRNRWHFGPYASSQAYGHTGWTGTVTVIDPLQNLGIVLLTNARHTPVNEDDSGQLHFAGSEFETGKYGSVITRVYEAILEK